MSDEGGARFSLPAGEGAGTMLGMAAGDTAGGASLEGYSSPTQQAVIMAYHLFRHGVVDRELLEEELAEMDGDDRDPPVYRQPSPELRAWLDSVRKEAPERGSDLSLDPAHRSVPLGVWFRRHPEQLVGAVLDSARTTNLDSSSAVLATAVAAAVAGGCFAQNGRDLLMAVAEVVERAAKSIESDGVGFARLDRLGDTTNRLRGVTGLLGASPDELEGGLGDPVGTVTVALALAAPLAPEPHRPLGTAAALGGSDLAALVGSIIGARSGVRPWPWTFPNDTWFMAIGERLVEGRTDLIDLPVPYAVEQRVTYSSSHPAL